VLRPTRPRAGRASGYTLIEMMITIAVLGILITLGGPALSMVLTNSRIRTAGESWKYGLMLARAEAIRLNTQVEFVSDATGWQVRQVGAAQALHQASGREGTSRLTITTTPEATDRVTFDSLGRRIDPNPSDDSEPIDSVDIESTNAPTGNGYRPLRVQVVAAGTARLCDPAVPATDARACL